MGIKWFSYSGDEMGIQWLSYSGDEMVNGRTIQDIIFNQKSQIIDGYT